MDIQISEPYSKLGLTNAEYRSFKDLGSLNSEEWSLMNPNTFKDFFMTLSIIFNNNMFTKIQVPS